MKSSFGLKHVVGEALALAWGMNSLWAAIEWQEPQNIVGDSDVSLNGTAVYAHTWSLQYMVDSIVVNGVHFVPDGTSCRGGTDVYSAEMHNGSGTNDGRSWGGTETSEACSEGYMKILQRTMFANQGVHSTVTLRNLVPARRYEVQVWTCSVFPEFAGRTATFDGSHAALINVGTSDAPARGQYVIGTFTCPANGEQSFSLAPESDSWAPINALQVRDITEDASIRWEEVRTISAETDVATEGRLVYAYNQSGQNAVVNGVPFFGCRTGSYVPNYWGVETYNNVCFPEINSVHPTAFCDNGPTEEYKKLLCGAAYADRLANASLLLRNLIPGKTYLFQLWVNDSRANFANHQIVVDGEHVIRYQDGAWGQYIIGRFQAVSRSQRIPIEMNQEHGSIQWNALQVRELNPGGIDWEQQVPNTDNESVASEGTRVFAYYWGTTEPVTVNGCEFKFPGRDVTKTAEIDISFNGFHACWVGNDFCPNWETTGIPSELHELLRGGLYAQRDRETEIVLHGLLPGSRYLVQIFTCDGRGGIARSDVIDGRTRLDRNRGLGENSGVSAIGRFTALSADQSIRFVTQCDVRTGNSEMSAQINAIQLRCLGTEIPLSQKTLWTIAPSRTAIDVSRDGVLKYAYTYSDGGLTVNGVSFTATGAGDAYGADVQLSETLTGKYNGYCGNYGNDPYRALLGNGGYRDGITSLDLTLNGLEAGHCYLVQIWVSDTRENGNIATRYWSPDDSGLECRYQIAANEPGSYALGRFVASESTHVVRMNFPTSNGQINAMQLRDLGSEEEGAVLRDPARFVLFGADQTLESVPSDLKEVMVYSGKATLAQSADQPIAFCVNNAGTVAVGADCTVTASSLDGEGRYAGPGTLVLANKHVGTSNAAFADGLTLRKQGEWDWFFNGPLDGVTLLSENGTTWICGEQNGVLTLAGTYSFLDSGLLLGEGATVTLEGMTALHVVGDLSLDGVTLHVKKARRSAHRVLLSAEGLLSGQPTFVFDEKGCLPEFDATLNAWCARMTGLTVFIR